jgi:NADPH:quinone reductase and related Zn-dependent oxidoreductases
MTGTMRAWRTHEYGDPLTALMLDEVPIPDPGPGEVRVKVQAIPLNLNDLERITGGNMMVRPDLPYSPGMEVMGVVDACGDGTETRNGQRVVAMPKGANGGYAEYAICPAVSTFAMPDSIPLPDAAALYFPFHLAWLGLVDRADVQAGETVLIHAAAGGSGSAAIQIAKHLGARVIATAGSDAKVALCKELGADVVINYAETDFAPVVLAETGDRGVDVVFDNVGEAVMESSMACTAYNGRYLMMGFASNKVVADEPFLVPRRVALGNFKLCGVLLAYADPDMSHLVKTAMGWNFASGELGARIMGEIVDLVTAGKVHAVVGETVGFDAIPAAIDAMARRATVGRTIVMLDA